MKAKLVVVGGDAKAAEINLKLPTIIGRGREAALTLPHPLVSRQHCEIYEQDDSLVVRDMGSLNGTFINNQRIEEATFLPSGDLLTIGAVTFRAVYGADFENSVAPGAGGDSANTPTTPSIDPAKRTVVEDDDNVEEGITEESDVVDVDFEELQNDVDELAQLGKTDPDSNENVEEVQELEEWDEIFDEIEDEDSDTSPKQ